GSPSPGSPSPGSSSPSPLPVSSVLAVSVPDPYGELSAERPSPQATTRTIDGSSCEAAMIAVVQPRKSSSDVAPGSADLRGRRLDRAAGLVLEHLVAKREAAGPRREPGRIVGADRKSTRLNSSHVKI